MKRDMESASNAEYQLAGSLCPTPASPPQPQTQASSCGEVDETTSCKRIKPTQVNGFIVYTRIKKSRFSGRDKFVGKMESKSLYLEEGKFDSTSSSVDENQKLPVIVTKIKDDINMENVKDSNLAVEKVTEEPLVEVSTAVKNVNGKKVMVETVAGDRHNVSKIKTEKSSMVRSLIEEGPLIEVVIEKSNVVEMATEEIPVEPLIEDSPVDFDSQGIENLIEDELYHELDMSMRIEEPISEPAELLAKEGGNWGIPVRNDIPGRSSRRFTRSALKLKEVEPLGCLDSKQQDRENEITPISDEEVTAEGNYLTTTLKNLELKMSKKIVLNKRPLTVKELFDTGLLDGVSVVYMGSVKSQAFGLRGIIKDGGILCSCSVCNGCRIIPPSKFEIHACKQYRRAAQYICFENGKSLLEVLKACRNIPLHALETTIWSTISAAPEERSFTCKRCKGLFPISCLGQVGPLCKSCSETIKYEVNPTCTSGLRVRSSGPVLTTKSSTSTSTYIVSSNKNQEKITQKASEPNTIPKLPKCPPVYTSSQNKRAWKITKKSSRPGLTGKTSRSPSPCIPLRNKIQWKKTKRQKKTVVRKSFKSAVLIPSQNNIQWRITTKDQRLHKLVFEKGGLPDGTEVAYYARGQKLLEGYKKGFGIFCRCCNCEVSPSQFEAHAGWASRRKPYAYIYTSNGVSLHELAISLSRGRKYSAKDNDDLCVICADGGNLLLCDGCPRAFHKECAHLPSIPRGDWYCKYCLNKFEREKFVEYNANAIAAGRVLGVDPIEQISRRCIRIIKNFDTELSGCALCRASDFSRSGFGPRTIIICDQCEKEYHIGCLRSHKMADLKALPKGKWFCCMDCTRIHSTLQKLQVSGAEKLSDSVLEVIRNKYGEKGSDAAVDVDVRWRLLSGKFTSSETRLLLSQALAIFHDCFDPIVDSVTGRNLIPCMVYGKNIKGQDYGGMYCAVLTINSSVVSAVVLRVFGREIAELPLVATRMGNHGKGYFQLLFSCIEKLLSFLNVESIVLPAAEEAEPLWINKFGFKKIQPDQLNQYRKSCCQMMRFKGASMLQKAVPPCRIISRNTGSVEPVIKSESTEPCIKQTS